MNGNKLNIQLEENVLECSIEPTQANILSDLLENSLATRNEIKGLSQLVQQKEFKELEVKLLELEIKLCISKEGENMCNEIIKDKNELIATLLLESTSLKTKLDNLMLDKVKKTGELELKIKEKDEQIDLLKSKIKNENENEIRIYTIYGTSTKLMYVPNLDPFEITQDDKIVGSGWIVIHRLTNGSLSFKQNFDAYKNGFGDPKADFWLGLERLHRITTHQQHELYIHIIIYKNKSRFARYDNFIVGSEEEQYELKSLGKYNGDYHDKMSFRVKQPFRMCECYGWWWNAAIPQCNLTEPQADTCDCLFWGNRQCKMGSFIKSVQMLIHPKTDYLQ